MNYANDCINTFPTLWSATVREDDPSRPLDGDTTCDVAIIGAGYTGLSAALVLARGGASVRVIEGGYPGWGGSGRNSGAVIRGFKSSRSGLIKEFGPQRGRAMADFGATTTDVVYDFIKTYDIQCDLKRTGWILPAHNTAGLRRVEERQRTWTADGIGGLDMLSRDELARMLGSSAYIGGMIDHEGASLNPLGYARGLARAAMAEGAAVYRETPAKMVLRAPRGWIVETSRGRVTAPTVIIAADAYSNGLNASVERTMATIHTNIVATKPLPAALAADILPGEQAVSDSRRILYYWHKDPYGRVLFGTRGTLSGPRQPEDFAHVETALGKIYPQLRGAEIEFRWSGKVGLTRDFLPHIDQPEPGLWTSHGYCGRGVAMASAYGKLLGETILQDRSPATLPVPNTPAPRMPPAPISDLGIVTVTQLYRVMDIFA
ncbi:MULTISPECIES: FAD-binding oxidoreductase [unclassified Chelatococcus]|uniref:NAD(P)/FAD-dependent oxidoreductase n=1 Tax=unclassified Chelatococcus TaxID=2638111 RepID=UPI001BCD1F16|nr:MULTISPECIES: FAD-binding oxidoreductase [unclassified Chelatococcus]MBS7699703.1 FAD-binding oxidoreductase [Chelatococcus sp. YT9]MBX3557099.1 FAD-binding oxidoreductase [Chelatococcus sp.]